MLDNQDFAVYSKLNELAERRGLKPYDFTAQLRHVDGGTWSLAFDPVHVEDERRRRSEGERLEARLDTMMRDLGVNDDGELIGTTDQIIDALDRALSRSPCPRIAP